MSEILSVIQGHTDADVTAIVQSSSKVVLMFSGAHCPPCKRLYPIFNQLATSMPTIKFVKVDVDEFQKASSDFDIKRMPTFLFYHNGTCVNRIEGGASDALSKACNDLLKMELCLLDKYAPSTNK